MSMSRELSSPLTNLLYAIAEEDADDWATGAGCATSFAVYLARVMSQHANRAEGD
jgi:hypothetical protein